MLQIRVQTILHAERELVAITSRSLRRTVRGLPAQPIEIILPDGSSVVWEPTGEVRTMR